MASNETRPRRCRRPGPVSTLVFCFHRFQRRTHLLATIGMIYHSLCYHGSLFVREDLTQFRLVRFAVGSINSV